MENLIMWQQFVSPGVNEHIHLPVILRIFTGLNLQMRFDEFEMVL